MDIYPGPRVFEGLALEIYVGKIFRNLVTKQNNYIMLCANVEIIGMACRRRSSTVW